MKFFRIRCLIEAIKHACEDWKKTVWDIEDLDEQVCCSGLSKLDGAE